MSDVKVVYLPFGTAHKVEHAWARRAAVTLRGLLEQAVELKLLALTHTRRAVLWQRTDDLDGFRKLGVTHGAVRLYVEKNKRDRFGVYA